MKPSKQDNEKINLLNLFFTKYTWYGFFLILLSTIMDQYKFVNNNFYLVIIKNLISTLGIALFIGAIFDFSKNTEAFTLFVSNILKKIVVSKDFMSNMEEKEKENALELILKPTDLQMEQCSSIEMYYKKSIKSFMKLYQEPFKTGLIILLTVKKEKGKFVTRGELIHRIYKVNGKYIPIKSIFDTKFGGFEDTQLLSPDGKKIILDANKDISSIINDDGQYIYETSIPEEFCHHPYLTVKRNVFEEGCDHWIAISWSSLTACDGINFSLNCQDNSTVKKHLIFDDEQLYNISVNESKTSISIISSSWLNSHTGFVVIVSDTNECFNENISTKSN